jgi:hypothetical protein
MLNATTHKVFTDNENICKHQFEVFFGHTVVAVISSMDIL